MVLNYQQPSFVQVRSFLTIPVLPIQYLVAAPTKIFEWTVDNFSSHRTLQDANNHLQIQVLLLQAQLQKLVALEQENNQLRAMLQSYPRTSDRVLVTELLSVDSDPFIHEVTLNQGERSGVYVGQPVLDATGVLGQVISVGPFTSRVLLLTDTRSAIPTQDNRNGIRGIIVGTGNPNYLQLAHIPVTTNIQVGDVFVTSGLDGHFPSGYPVGSVTSVIHNPGDEFASITITPSAQINRSQLVLLVWPNNTNAQMDNMMLQNQVTLAPKKACTPGKRGQAC